MNERLKEIEKQATRRIETKVRKGGWDNDREPYEYKTVVDTFFDKEKFAELIVRECVYVLEKNISPLQMKIFASKYPELIPMSSLEIQDRNRNGHIEGLLLGAEAIEKYFGVGE